MYNRGFIVTARTVKKHAFKEDEIKIEITDGLNTMTFYGQGTFTVDAETPFPDPLLKKDPL